MRRYASTIIIGIGGLLWLAAILFMAQTAQNSEQFGRCLLYTSDAADE